MSAADRQDPGIVRFDDSEMIQVFRAALNTVDTLVVREIDPPAGIFDPVRLEMARALNEFFATAQEKGATGEFRLDPSERVTARQALGAIEKLATGPREPRLQGVGSNPSGDNLQDISMVLSRIQHPGPRDLAGTDTRTALYTRPLDGALDTLKGQVYAADEDPRLPSVRDLVDRMVGVRTTDDPCPEVLDILEKLALRLSTLFDESRGVRLDTLDTLQTQLTTLSGVLSDRRCFRREDRARLMLAASKAIDSLETATQRERLTSLLDMVYWTYYRRNSRLTNTDPTGF